MREGSAHEMHLQRFGSRIARNRCGNGFCESHQSWKTLRQLFETRFEGRRAAYGCLFEERVLVRTWTARPLGHKRFGTTAIHRRAAVSRSLRISAAVRAVGNTAGATTADRPVQRRAGRVQLPKLRADNRRRRPARFRACSGVLGSRTATRPTLRTTKG